MTETTLLKAPLLVERFAQALQAKGRSPLTIRNYTRGVREFTSYLASEEKVKDLREVDPALLSRWQSFLFRSPKRYRLTTQLGLLISVRVFFGFLEKESLILGNPTTQMELPRKPRTLPLDTFSEKEMKRLFKAVDLEKPLGLRDRAILEVLYSTGVRAGELASLKCFDLDPGLRTLTIRQGKGAKDRVVPIGEVALHYVLLYLQQERPGLSRDSSETLFLTRKGHRMTSANPTQIVKTYAKKAAIERMTNSHMIRRSCATHMLRRRAPIRYIQELLGHRSLDTTERYTRVVITDLKKIHHQTHPRELD